MAIGFGRAIASALGGTLEGLAEAAVREDEKRDELSKVVLAQRIKNSEKALELSLEQTKTLQEENDAVTDLMTIQVGGKPMSRAEATKVFRTAKSLNIDPVKVLEQFSVESEKGGQLVATPAKTRKVAGDETAKMMAEEEEDAGFIRRGRAKSVDETATKLLRAAGYLTEIEIPQAPTVTGVTLTPKGDTDVDFSTSYVIGQDGIPVEQVLTKRTYNKDTGKTNVEYISQTTGKPVSIGKDMRVSSSADAFSQEKPFSDFGPLMVFGKDGLPELLKDSTGKVVSGYLMKNGEIRLQKAGKISDQVYDTQGQTVLIAGKDYAPSVASGDLSAFGKMFKFPPVKDFYTQLPEMDTAARANDILFSRSQKRLDLHAKYGDSMYGIEGGFADLVTATNKVVKGTASIVLGLSGMKGNTLDEKLAYLDSSGQISELRNVVDNQDELMQGVVGSSQEIAMARTIDAAIATVTAYDLAKQTGDTRISNQDFDAYISTVTGKTADQTIKLIRNGLDDSLTIYTSKHGAVSRARNRIPDIAGTEEFQESFDEALTTVVHPSVYRQRFKEMFAPFEGQVRIEATEEVPEFTYKINQEANEAVITIAGQRPLRVPLPPQEEPYTKEEIRNVLKSFSPQLER